MLSIYEETRAVASADRFSPSLYLPPPFGSVRQADLSAALKHPADAVPPGEHRTRFDEVSA